MFLAFPLTASASWTQEPLTTGTRWAAVGAVDADQDGDLDLVAAGYTGTRLYTNDGAGHFGPGLDLGLSWTSSPEQTRVADLDHDGLEDVVIGGTNTYTSVPIVVLWGRPAGSPSPFVAETLVSSTLQTFDFDLGDVDGDGWSDLVLTGLYAGLSVYRNLGGTLAPPTLLAADDRSHQVVVADVDGDGDGDVATAAMLASLYGAPISAHVRVYPSLGGAAFGARTESQAPTSYIRELHAADFTGNGAAELVVANEDGLWAMEVGGGAPVDHPIGEVFYLGSSDLDGDGRLDLVASGADDTSWFGATTGPQGRIVHPYVGRLVLADLDGDGADDVVSSDYDTLLWTGLRGGRFGPPRLVAVCATDGPLFPGDLDGDGLTDLAWVAEGAEETLRVARSVGGPPGPVRVIPSQGLGPASDLATGDANGDGRTDLVARFPDGVYAIPATATFAPGAATWVATPTNGTYGPLHVADLTADGVPDVTAFGAGTRAEIWQGGALADTITTARYTGDSEVVDLDGDGLDDAVWQTGTTFGFCLHDGTRCVPGPTPTAPAGYQAATVEVVDWDGDGDGDVLTGPDRSEGVALFDNLGNGTFAPGVVLLPGTSGDVHAADMDLDGDPDLVIRNLALQLYLRGAGGRLGAPQELLPWGGVGSVGEHFALHDVDADGDPDVIAVRSYNLTLLRNGTVP